MTNNKGSWFYYFLIFFFFSDSGDFLVVLFKVQLGNQTMNNGQFTSTEGIDVLIL